MSFTRTSGDLGDDLRPVVGDFDGDGDDDLLAYRAGAPGDTVLHGGPDGVMTRVRHEVGARYRPFTGDFDGDTRTDVFW